MFWCSQWCADLFASVSEVTTAMTESQTSKNQNVAHRGDSAYDAVTEMDKGEDATAADDAVAAKLRRGLIAYVERSLELPSSAKL